MFEVVIIIQILSLSGFAVLFKMIRDTKQDVLKDMQENNNNMTGGMVMIAEKLQESFKSDNTQTYKDAKNMMNLRMEEFKFAMLAKAGEFISGKFMKSPVGIHQLMTPDEGNPLKPASDGEEYGKETEGAET